MRQKEKGQAYTAESLQDPQAVAEMKRAVGGSDELPPADFQEPELALSDEARKASEEAAVTRLVRINELATGVAKSYRTEAVLQSHYEAQRDPRNREGIAQAVAWREQTLSAMNAQDRRDVLRASMREAIGMLKELATISVDEALSGKTGKFYLFNPAEEYEKNGEKRWHGSTHILLECYEHTGERSGETGLYVRTVWFVGGLKWLGDKLRGDSRFVSLREFQLSVREGEAKLLTLIKDKETFGHLRTMLKVMVRAIKTARETEAEQAEKAKAKKAVRASKTTASAPKKAAKKSVRKKSAAKPKRSVRTTSTRE